MLPKEPKAYNNSAFYRFRLFIVAPTAYKKNGVVSPKNTPIGAVG
jgi:hypothetical protein